MHCISVTLGMNDWLSELVGGLIFAIHARPFFYK